MKIEILNSRAHSDFDNFIDVNMLGHSDLMSKTIDELHSAVSKLDSVINDPEELIPSLSKKPRLPWQRTKYEFVLEVIRDRAKTSRSIAILQIKKLEAENTHQNASADDAISAEIETIKNNHKISMDRAINQISILERKADIVHKFLQKDTLSAIIGAFLLFIFILIELYAAIYDKNSPELVQNAFLLVLGYFFGQASNTLSRRHKDSDR